MIDAHELSRRMDEWPKLVFGEIHRGHLILVWQNEDGFYGDYFDVVLEGHAARIHGDSIAELRNELKLQVDRFYLEWRLDLQQDMELEQLKESIQQNNF